ncbi:HAMP domain-containing sensor histidine kinase [Paenibacillus aurantius]|uniref:histidine kinase n=1 Tax=Paenibacillus aurantius TaxID=2918900 RepID=A0AA96RE43_9BACL|nr:HAMP domain-containing sensor histidine kinase [Paenibacillus aurantius]WNQ10106.1 HAMP domain-containing sensor histidine kinase [Paenibacillus aurantius]
MGQIGLIERQPLKRQLILTFVWILLLSAVCSAAAMVSGFWWLTRSSWFQPANAYENQLPAIKDYVRSQHDRILDPASRPELEKRIPSEGIQYQVTDTTGRPIYGTLAERAIPGQAALLEQLNRTAAADPSFGFGGRFREVMPLSSAGGEWKGAILLQYKLEATASGGSVLWAKAALALLFLVSPFLFITLFTYLFAGRFGRRLARPVQELIEASKRIRDQDLDFTVTYKVDNELGLLTESFENMRSALKSSLLREWRLEQERRDMMDAIAHDFRTPMTIIQGNVELLADMPELTREKAAGHLRVLEDNIRRVNRLIQDVEIASEKDIDYFPLRVEKVTLAEFLADKERELRFLCRSRGIGCTFTFEDEASEEGPQVDLDVERISQVLDNLMANAIRYVPSADARLDLRVRRQTGTLEIELCDNGPGFRDQDLPHLFDKFYTGDKGQTGLGLYTAKLIAEKHGGGIRAGSRPEGGACLRFWVRTTGVK